jgi:hypothetical protein
MIKANTTKPRQTEGSVSMPTNNVTLNPNGKKKAVTANSTAGSTATDRADLIVKSVRRPADTDSNVADASAPVQVKGTPPYAEILKPKNLRPCTPNPRKAAASNAGVVSGDHGALFSGREILGRILKRGK